jgi:predicted permease
MSWSYLPVLNSLIQICLTILIGYCSEAFGIVPAALFVPQAVNVVFKILLPCLIINGVGIGIDFYAEKNIWAFIVACEFYIKQKEKNNLVVSLF